MLHPHPLQSCAHPCLAETFPYLQVSTIRLQCLLGKVQMHSRMIYPTSSPPRLHHASSVHPYTGSGYRELFLRSPQEFTSSTLVSGLQRALREAFQSAKVVWEEREGFKVMYSIKTCQGP